MMFWTVAAALLALTLFFLLRALRPAAPLVTSNDDVRFYEAQLVEIGRQRQLGLIGEREAEAARTEAARRLLAAAEESGAAAPQPFARRWERLAAALVLVVVPACGLGLYLAIGRPEQPAQPLAARLAEQPRIAGMTMNDAVGRIEAHLARNPNDGRGHEVIAPVYLQQGRFADAVRAYGTALRVLGPSADRHANLGEAMVYEANGVVTVAAKEAFAAALALEPRHVKARFFVAMAAQQDSDRPRALALLESLRGDLPPGDLRREVDRQVAALGGAPAAASPPETVPEGGQAIAALPPGEQVEAIRGMVEGLAQRLATTGGTAQDWARLIRALTVLGESPRAAMILGEAREKFSGDPAGLALIEEAARGAVRPHDDRAPAGAPAGAPNASPARGRP